MKHQIAKSIFKLCGWTYHIEPNVVEQKQVIIGVEHTSNLDGILAVALLTMLDIKAHTLVKKELFKGPLKPILQRLGGVAVDRHNKKDIVAQMVQRFKDETAFSLIIAPQATRAKHGEERQPIKTGFWYIAYEAQVPIVLMYANPKTKQGGILAKIYPTDLQQDLKTIAKLYKEHVGLEIRLPVTGDK